MKHIVFDNADVSAAYENARENLSYRGIDNPSDSEIWDEVSLLEQEDLEAEELDLKSVGEGGGLVVLASLGLWSGEAGGVREIASIEDSLYLMPSCDFRTLYVDSNGDLRLEGSHHDGSNSCLVRYWKKNTTERQKDLLMDKWIFGKATRSDISRYTRRAGLKIAEMHGWKVRGL